MAVGFLLYFVYETIIKRIQERKSMEQSLKEDILEKLEQLPESALREVRDFVVSISLKSRPQDDPVLAVAGILSGPPLSVEEIEQELYGERSS